MSVYTLLQTQEFERILSQYNLGKLITFEGIAAGIENTNYKLTLQKDDQTQFYFLTIFEQLKKSELEFFMPLLSHLQDNDCQLASPIKSIHGDLTFTIKKKDAAIFYCLPGKTLSTPNVHQCRLIGAQLAKVHKAAQTFTQSHENNRGFYWLQRQVHCKQLKLTQANQQIMETELIHLQACWQQWGEDNALPKGFIHADLFPDNSLFVGDTLSGIIDFYAGGSDYWVYDVAICIMAWCQSDKQTIDDSLKAALLEGYQSQRQLSQSEMKSLPDFLRLAVLRFWISRVLVQNQQQQASLTTFKDPNEMKALLLNLKTP